MKILSCIAVLFLLISCSAIDIAPDETWDGDDTSIWINEASGFDLDSFWFREKSSTYDSTVLEYKQEFEKPIVKQIIQSKYFNQLSVYDSLKIIPQKQDTLKGVWIKSIKGYTFLQFNNNQYPMSISVDTIGNTIVTHNVR